MSQSLNKILIHAVFSTKNRQHLIDEKIETELYSFIGGICRDLECPPFQIGGYSDHIHILSGFSKTIHVVDFMGEVKKRSSRWIKTKGELYSNFHWQDGYAVFSINPQDRLQVVEYIKNQHEHHAEFSFQDECRALFKKFDVVYDERFVWG